MRQPGRPHNAWIQAGSVSFLLLLALALVPGAQALDTAAIDLRHRAVWLREGPAVRSQPSRQPPFVGANVFLEQEVETWKRRESLRLLRAAGVTYVRQQLPWEQIEPVARGQFVDPKFGISTWAKFDEIVQLAAEADVRLLFRLDTSPRWALPPDAPDGLGPPLRYEDYWDFVTLVAERYRGRVAAYQVWNEPNLHIEWGRQPPDPAAYARLLAGAAERIRRADPNALVVSAAMAPTLTESAEALNELQFLEGMYAAGARGAFDVLAVQAYGLRGGPDDPRVDVDDVTFSRPTLVRALMERQGDQATPLWATEFGWNVNPAQFEQQRFGRVTPPLQARYTVRGIERARAEWPWLEGLFAWYWKRPDAQSQNQDWYWFRLADPDFELQPAYRALQDAAALGRVGR